MRQTRQSHFHLDRQPQARSCSRSECASWWYSKEEEGRGGPGDWPSTMVDTGNFRLASSTASGWNFVPANDSANNSTGWKKNPFHCCHTASGSLFFSVILRHKHRAPNRCTVCTVPKPSQALRSKFDTGMILFISGFQGVFLDRKVVIGSSLGSASAKSQ